MELVVLGEAGLSACRRFLTDPTLGEKLSARYSETFLSGILEEAAPSVKSQQTGSKEAAFGEDAFTGNHPAKEALLLLFSGEGIPEEDRADAARDGVLAALWRLLHQKHLGAEFSQRAVPVRQETVEICETLGLDPYRLPSEGCCVCLTGDGARLTAHAKAHGIEASVIGFTTPGPAIIRTDGETISYLRRPQPEKKP